MADKRCHCDAAATQATKAGVPLCDAHHREYQAALGGLALNLAEQNRRLDDQTRAWVRAMEAKRRP